jgi:hypothetical protein
MNKPAQSDPQIVASRLTFDRVLVFVHADGSLSDRLNFLRGGRLPLATLWRKIDDICLYTHAELPEYTRTTRTRHKRGIL